MCPWLLRVTCEGFKHPGLKIIRINADLFVATLVMAEWTWTVLSADAPLSENDANSQAESLVRNVIAACDVAYPSGVKNRGRIGGVFWWNEKIPDTRVECVCLRTVFSRLHSCGDTVTTAAADVEFGSAHKELKHHI